MRAGIATDHSFSSDVVTSASTWLDRWALDRIRSSVPSAPIRFVLWDGFERQGAAGPTVATIVFKNRQALLSWVRDPQLNFGETYMFGAVEVRGDLVALLEAIYNALPSSTSHRWRFAPAANDERAARENVHCHYDLGNQFYRLWLDQQLLYTCAYLPTPECSLEDAQVSKMDLVCRKLALQPGERVVEAGCGWGALALHMARHYGVTVKAFNVSVEQIAHARTRAREEGLDGRVEFVLDDYRSVRGAFDVFVSVGMLEHVGLADYETFGQVIDGAIGSNGRGLLHFIGRNQALPLNPWIRKRIFPGAYPPTLGEVFGRMIEPTGLSVLDVENLRLHYALTLRHWRSRFLDAVDQVRTMFDDPFTRAWDLYLAGSQAAFTTGSMQLFQVVFARGSTNAIPWTRRDGHL